MVPLDLDQWVYGENVHFAYAEGANELHYLKSGEAITRQTEYWVARRDDLPADRVAEIVQNAYAIEMVGKILHALDSFVRRQGWTDSLEAMLSPRVLTFASLGFIAADALIEQNLVRAASDIQQELFVTYWIGSCVLGYAAPDAATRESSARSASARSSRSRSTVVRQVATRRFEFRPGEWHSPARACRNDP
jgi:hypothetical protein